MHPGEDHEGLGDKGRGADRLRRDDWLRLSDAALLKECHQERFRAGGPGGQRRNKVETAIRLLHRPTGLLAQATESRLLRENRARALRRLREGLALELRQPLSLDPPSALPPEFLAHRRPGGGLSINPSNDAYPIVLATVLDALVATDMSYARAAQALGVTTSQLLRFLRSAPLPWRRVGQMRRREAKD